MYTLSRILQWEWSRAVREAEDEECPSQNSAHNRNQINEQLTRSGEHVLFSAGLSHIRRRFNLDFGWTMRAKKWAVDTSQSAHTELCSPTTLCVGVCV